MQRRALLEVVKYLALEEALVSAVRVATEWRSAVYAEETLLFFLSRDEGDSDPALPLYERLKQQQLTRSPNYLLHVAGSKACVWRVLENSEKSVREAHDLTFVNSSRYALISPSTAVVTGGAVDRRRCSSINLVTLAITRLSDLLEDRKWHGIASLKGHIYISGGDLEGKYLTSAEVFDGKEWRRIADMTMPRYNLTLSVFRSAIYAFGGSNCDGYLRSIEYFGSSQWHLAEMALPTPRNYSSVTEYKGSLVLVGGYDPNEMSSYMYVWEKNDWRSVQALTTNYSLSNAVAIKQGVCYFYDHRPERLQFAANL